MERNRGDGALRVAIVDNDVCALDMMALLIGRLGPSITVPWKATRAQDALEHCLFDDLVPDVVVLDLALCGISGVDVCREIRVRNATTGIIGVSAYPLAPYRSAMIEAGAQALFDKRRIGTPLFRDALRCAGRGLPAPECDGFDTAQAAHERLRAGDGRHARLSPRELDVLRLYSQGLATDEVCTRLGISANTALSHVNHAAHKLGVRRRTDAIRACRDLHLLD